MEKTSLKTMTRNSQVYKLSGEKTLGQLYSEEMAAEENASRKCLERIPIEKLFEWKPHEKSMQMGYLAIMVAEIPKWITYILTKGDIDFATWKMTKIKTTEELVKYFDKNIKDAKKVLENVSNEELEESFSLKRADKILDTSSKNETIRFLINHWVHHRGQLTVYMRLNDIPVPSIYGPSADENIWK
jgi:uncharacterized damage-inducible protein DinB